MSLQFVDALKDALSALRSPRLSPSEQFADWLPYSAYIAEEQLFVNRDGLGFVLEVLPQAGADERMVEVLMALFATSPAGTGLQFHLLASPHLRPTLRRYANLRLEDEDQAQRAARWGRPVRNRNLFRRLARQRVGHLLHGARRSLTSGFHYQLRDFRLLFSVCMPGHASDGALSERLLGLRDSMTSTLQAASLPNRVCDATDLIRWCALFTNGDRLLQVDAVPQGYDPGRELRDQMVDADTLQDAHPNALRFWKADHEDVLEARFFSVKGYPEHYALWQMGALIGDVMQPELHYHCPFLLTLGVHILDPHQSKAVVTGNHVRATQNARSKMAQVMPDVSKKLQDWSAAAQALDSGGNLVSLYHQLALFCRPEQATAASETAQAIWRSRGFALNADTYLQRQALLASLPMSLSPRLHKDLLKMRRVTRKT